MKKSWVVLSIIGAIVVWQLIGAFSLATQQESVAGDVGKVWSASKRAVEVISNLQGQVEFFTADRQTLIDKIASARADYAAAKESGNLTQLDQAVTTLGQIKVIVEAYPQVDLSESQRALMDETAGSINRVKTARDTLIDSQVAFNSARIVFFPVGMLFPHKAVLGSDADPASDLNIPGMGQGDYKK